MYVGPVEEAFRVMDLAESDVASPTYKFYIPSESCHRISNMSPSRRYKIYTQKNTDSSSIDTLRFYWLASVSLTCQYKITSLLM